uniref:Phosphoribosylanthranilate isomerase n=1 Tax=Cryptomonas curvata TaxID=233186 RepID=A0A7S0LTR1_9CRYP
MSLNLSLQCIGFCGVDDSVDPRLLAAVSQRYDWVEWGVLFRDDMQGKPRFATFEWLDDLNSINRSRFMKLAAHLCSKYITQLLNGDTTFVKFLRDTHGFRRFQLNATAANNVDSSSLGPTEAAALRKAAEELSDVEFIIQRNEETKALWEGLLSSVPPNVSFLFDESKGRGTVLTEYPPPPPQGVRFGYTGGLGPDNLKRQLELMASAGAGREIWVDMESSMRTRLADGGDVFDVAKAVRCVRAVIELGLKPEAA